MRKRTPAYTERVEKENSYYELAPSNSFLNSSSVISNSRRLARTMERAASRGGGGAIYTRVEPLAVLVDFGAALLAAALAPVGKRLQFSRESWR